MDFTVEQILGTAYNTKKHIENNKQIPPVVNINGYYYPIAQFTDMMLKTLLQLAKGDKTTRIPLRNVVLPASSEEAIVKQELPREEYLDFAKRIVGHIDNNGALPAFGICGSGKVPWQSIVYAYARLLAWYKNGGDPPIANYVNIYKWTGSPAVGYSTVTNNGACFQSVRLLVLKQEYSSATKLTCGPTSVCQALAEWSIFPSIELAAAFCNTQVGYGGTTPADIIAGVPELTKRYGIRCKAYLQTLSQIGGWSGLGAVLADPKKTVIAHVAWKGTGVPASSCTHYHTPEKLCTDSQKIWIAENFHGQMEEYAFAGYLPMLQKCDQPSFLVFEQV